MRSNHSLFAFNELFEPPEDAAVGLDSHAGIVSRTHRDLDGRVHVVLDRFPGVGEAACCFVRIASNGLRSPRFVVDGAYGWESCAAGGWLLKPGMAGLPHYWLPRLPVYRSVDANGRIVFEQPATLATFVPAPGLTTFELSMCDGHGLDCALWRFDPCASEFIAALERPSSLDRQAHFMWASHTSLQGLADVYRFLIHGRVYEDRFDLRHKRKICCELEAWALYVALHGLEASSANPALHRVLKRQVVGSIVERQTADGGWQHGEWTDFMESHYRFHNAAMHTLAAALEESPSEAVRSALDKGAAVLSQCTDQTGIGLWFMHDSLEHSVELTRRGGLRLIPSRELGKSPANRTILNTHLDAIVTLDRYREVRGDARYVDKVDSAVGAARTLLALRPAETLYRALYWAVRLTLVPPADASRLPLPLKVAKRLARRFVLPNLHRVKRRIPRMVMPGGLIERHLSRLHFGTNYHSVNVADLARVWRRFPREDFDTIIAGAVAAVTTTPLPAYWAEVKQKQALGYWVEAMYQLCTLKSDPAYRRHLAEAMLNALDSGLGLSPSLLGAHPEVVKPAERIACPSPADARLRVANIIHAGRQELVVVNPTHTAIDLAWETEPAAGFAWRAPDGQVADEGSVPKVVPPRGWLWSAR